ncbi:MAG: RagB/SusD family nutrient uptake outer membrane protein [Bacteroidales bacterium]
MKALKKTLLYTLLAASTTMIPTSCSNWLELSPEDYYGSGSYWKTEAQVVAYIDGIHKHLRDAAWQHSLIFGELRGGMFKNGVNSDGITASYGSIILQNFDERNTGVSKFGDLYGRITNLNLFISRVTDADYIGQEKKNFFLAQVYGLRAFYYFDLYRIYGGVPIRLIPEVVDGVTDPNLLYIHRSTPKEVMAQIKSDISKSLELFGNVNDFDPYKRGNKVYWSKAATETLKGEVYLWTAKVSTGDDTATPSDINEAKASFESVVNNYKLSLQPSFEKVFDAQNNKANSEIIFAIRFLEGESTNSMGSFLYNMATGSTKDRFLENGEKFGDPLGIQTTGNQTMEYDTLLFNSFDEKDTRKLATFIGSYEKDTLTNVVSLYGTHVRKNIGYINAQGTRIYCGDMAFYRLPLVYLYLAEIANYAGDNAGVEQYINLVRKRAYGKSWDEAVHGFKAGDFTKNELAILSEKDKEFIQEGQRWWDLRRMTLTKDGKPLVFCPEGNPKANGLPILNEATEKHKLLWPIERGMLDNDPKLTQTPGY